MLLSFSRNQPFLNVLEYQNANHMRRQPLSRGIKFWHFFNGTVWIQNHGILLHKNQLEKYFQLKNDHFQWKIVNFQLQMTKFTRFQKYFKNLGRFVTFKSDNFERQIKNYFIEFKYWEFGIRDNEFLRSFRFYKRKYIYRFGRRTCCWQGEYIKNSHFWTIQNRPEVFYGTLIGPFRTISSQPY